MSMIKVFAANDFGFDDITVSPMHFSRDNRIDAMTEKRANVLAKDIADFKPEPGYTYTHVLAVGDSDFFGPNRNSDGFTEHWNKKAHHRFVKSGRAHRNHKNKDPKEAIGKIALSAHNDDCHRIELVVGWHNEKAAQEVQTIESGKDLAVSMGCVLDPEYPVLTSTGYRPISEIGVGDVVYTHAGNWRRVTEVNHRRYTGKVVDLEINGLPLPLPLTAEHPMFAKVFSAAAVAGKKTRAYANEAGFEAVDFGWAHAEHLENGDHILYAPVVYDRSQICTIDSVDLARFLGFYLAEGSFLYNGDKPSTVQFTCHMDDDLPKIVPGLVSKMFPGVNCVMMPHPKSAVGLAVNVYCTELACFVEKYVGHLAKNKRIPLEIFEASDEVRLAFLGAWLSGDGFVDAKGVHWSSANRNLMLQARDLLARLGISASIYRIQHKAGVGFSKNATVEYTLNISAIDAKPLLPYAERKLSGLNSVLRDEKKSGCRCLRFNADGTMSYRVRAAAQREVVDAPIYNFEVEGDHSYSLAGLASHNCKIAFDVCSICGNKAPTPDEHCQCMKKHAGKVLEDGRQVYVDNPDPFYFELSSVIRPADRCGYSFRKIASFENGDSVKAASDAGLWLPVDMACPESALRARTKYAVLMALAEMEKQVPATLTPMDSLLASVAPRGQKVDAKSLAKLKTAGLGAAMEGLNSAQVILPVKDFIKLIDAKGDVDDCDDVGDAVESRLPGIFGRLMSDPDAAQRCCDNEAFDGGCPADGLSDVIGNLIPDLGLGEGALNRRVTIAVIKKPKAEVKTAAAAYTGDPLVEGIANLYAAYKLAFLSHSKNACDAVLTQAVLFGNYQPSP